MRLWRYSGLYLLMLGLIHMIFGLVVCWDRMCAIVTDGLVSQIESSPERAEFFWFMVTGLVLLILGYLIHWMVFTREIRPPKALGWMLLGLTVIGALAIPLSGFVLFLPVGLVMVWGR